AHDPPVVLRLTRLTLRVGEGWQGQTNGMALRGGRPLVGFRIGIPHVPRARRAMRFAPDPDTRGPCRLAKLCHSRPLVLLDRFWRTGRNVSDAVRSQSDGKGEQQAACRATGALWSTDRVCRAVGRCLSTPPSRLENSCRVPRPVTALPAVSVAIWPP